MAHHRAIHDNSEKYLILGSYQRVCRVKYNSYKCLDAEGVVSQWAGQVRGALSQRVVLFLPSAAYRFLLLLFCFYR